MEESHNSFLKIEKVDVTYDMFHSICRICFGSENLQSVDTEREGIKAIDILQTCALIKVDDNDKLPQHLCENCIELIYEYYLFLEECRYADKKLRKILKKAIRKQTNQLNDSKEHDYCSKLISEENVIEDIKPKICRTGKCNEENIVKVIELNLDENSEFDFECLNPVDGSDDEDLQDGEYETIKIEYLPDNFNESLSYGEESMSCDENLQSEQRKGKNNLSKEKLKCEFCCQEFNNASNLLRHKYVHSNDKPHKCEICSKSFTRKESLKIHMKYHTGEKHNVCPYCQKEFTTISNYNRHIQQHKLFNGELPEEQAEAVLKMITCPDCNKTFSSKHTLKTHMMVHAEKMFACDICGKKFTFRGNLRSHYRSHSGEKPFKCPICSKAFAFNNSLKEHIYIHTGERPHRCTYCGKGFAQQQQLKTHIRIHTGERPYTCSYCGKSFANKVNMTVHIRIHTGDTPFTCSECGKGFHDSSSLKKHKKKHAVEKEIALEYTEHKDNIVSVQDLVLE